MNNKENEVFDAFLRQAIPQHMPIPWDAPHFEDQLMQQIQALPKPQAVAAPSSKRYVWQALTGIAVCLALVYGGSIYLSMTASAGSSLGQYLRFDYFNHPMIVTATLLAAGLGVLIRLDAWLQRWADPMKATPAG
ncbi:MAG TPA: hypothetical protein DCM08_11320 [Microscillaceae bacterium]|nr:hypothetical protein [Microscillaceae bacterium]